MGASCLVWALFYLSQFLILKQTHIMNYLKHSNHTHTHKLQRTLLHTRQIAQIFCWGSLLLQNDCRGAVFLVTGLTRTARTRHVATIRVNNDARKNTDHDQNDPSRDTLRGICKTNSCVHRET